MAFPSYPQIEIALLEILRGLGGEGGCDQIIDKLADHFGLTLEERKIKDDGQYKFSHMCHTARVRLVRKGQIAANSPRGIWRITEERPPSPSIPPPTPSHAPDRLQDEIKGLVDKLAELAKERSRDEPRLAHDELVERIKEMGQMLGKSTEPVPQAEYRHDCVWRPNRWANPELVWEVCDKGVLEKDIVSLTWAVDTWKAKGIVVIFEEGGFRKVQERFAQIYPIKAEDVVQIHHLLKAGNIKLLKTIFSI